MRPIDGDALKSIIQQEPTDGMYTHEILAVIDEQSTIEPYGAWIPCSERLPNKPEFGWDGYLVQDAYIVKPYDAYWNGKCWTDIDDNVLDNIVAWMPLPEPYGEE